MLVDIKKDGVTYYGISQIVAVQKGLIDEYAKELARLILSKTIDCRKNAYIEESDPLFLEWQYDQSTEKEQAWRDKVAEIKIRYPLPTAQ